MDFIEHEGREAEAFLDKHEGLATLPVQRYPGHQDHHHALLVGTEDAAFAGGDARITIVDLLVRHGIGVRK